jgi:hypothetical protein
VARARGAGTRGTRALSFRRARVSPRDDGPVEARFGFFVTSRLEKAERDKKRESTAARFANARGLARAGFVARTIARSPRRYARVLRFVRCRAA